MLAGAPFSSNKVRGFKPRAIANAKLQPGTLILSVPAARIGNAWSRTAQVAHTGSQNILRPRRDKPRVEKGQD